MPESELIKMVSLLRTSVTEGQSPDSLHPESSGCTVGAAAVAASSTVQHPVFTDTVLVVKNLPAVGFN